MLADLRKAASELREKRDFVENFYSKYAGILSSLEMLQIKVPRKLTRFSGSSDEYKANIKLVEGLSGKFPESKYLLDNLAALYKDVQPLVTSLGEFNDMLIHAVKPSSWMFRGIESKFLGDKYIKSQLNHKVSQIGCYWTIDPEVGVSFSGKHGPVFATEVKYAKEPFPKTYGLSDVRFANELEIGARPSKPSKLICFLDDVVRGETMYALKGVDIEYREISKLQDLEIPL